MPDQRGRRLGAKGAVYLFALFSLLTLIITSTLNMARIGYTYLVVYPYSLSSISDPEPVRWAASNYGIAHLIKFANETLAEDDRIFAFRQSDLAYYAKNPIAVYTDNAYAPLFKLKSPQQLKAALLKDNIRYVALPPYGMAEVNNSAFAVLLSDPAMAQLIFEQDGDRLFELTESETTTPELELVRTFDLRSKSEQDKWNAAMMPLPLLTSFQISAARLEQTSSGVTLRRNRPRISNEFLEDVLQPWDLSVAATPFLTGRSDFEVRHGLYRFEGLVAGKGLVNLYAEFYTNSTGQEVERSRKLLWSGVLNNETRNISGQFNILIDHDDVEFSRADRQSVRVFFGLKQGGYLSVQSLAIQKIAPSDALRGMASKQVREFESLQRAYRGGWENLKTARYSTEYSDPFNVFGMDDANTVFAKQTSGSTRVIASPTYMLTTDLLTSETAFRLKRTAEGVRPVVELSMTPRGNGLMSVAVIGSCLEDEGSANAGEQKALKREFEKDLQKAFGLNPQAVQSALYGRTEMNQKFLAFFQPVSLRQTGRTYRESVVLDCAPASIRAIFGVTHDSMKSPPDLRMAEVRIADFEIALTAWAGGTDTTDFLLVRSSDVRSPKISPPQTQLPDFGQ
jgi:hypothetical protein